MLHFAYVYNDKAIFSSSNIFLAAIAVMRHTYRVIKTTTPVIITSNNAVFNVYNDFIRYYR